MPRKAARKKKTLKLNSKRKNRKVTSYAFSSLFLFFVACFILLAGFSYKRISTVFVSAQSEDSINFDEKDIFTILIASADNLDSQSPIIKKAKLIIIDKKDLELTSVTIYADAVLDVPGKYGKEKVSDILALATSATSSENDAYDFFVKTFEVNLKVGIDRHILVNEPQFEEVNDLFVKPGTLSSFNLLKALTLNGLSKTFVTDVSDRELYATYSFLNQNPVVIAKTESEFRKSIKDIVFNSNIAEEKFMISVLNGSNIAGTGTYAADVVTNAGGRVTYVGNAKNSYVESLIVTDNPESNSVKYLREFFGIEKIESKAKYSFIESDVERADVTVILGIDLEKDLH